MVPPTLGVALSTVLVTARSACCGVTVEDPLLLPGTVSVWSEWLTLAVLVRPFGLTTVAVIGRVTVEPLAMVPMSQAPVIALYAPWLGVADTKFRPAGSRSDTATLVAASGPLFLTLTVKVMVSPTLGVALSTVLV